MSSNYQSYRTGFIDTAFEILCNNDTAFSIADFLFVDFAELPDIESSRVYRLLYLETEFVLYEGEEQLYCGDSLYQLTYTLINEIIFHCINHNDKYHALHAGAVWRDNCAIVLPASSGSGKSTLTAWLVANGFHYLTDELVFLAQDGSIIPFVRPMSFKVDVQTITSILKNTKAAKSGYFSNMESSEYISSDEGTMLSHRVLNQLFDISKRQISDIIFPHYKKNATFNFSEISPAKGTLHLMESHVNARNLDGHGIAGLSDIVRKCKVWHLYYGDFAEIESIFNSSSGLFR